jgi:hypothetical protein
MSTITFKEFRKQLKEKKGIILSQTQLNYMIYGRWAKSILKNGLMKCYFYEPILEKGVDYFVTEAIEKRGQKKRESENKEFRYDTLLNSDLIDNIEEILKKKLVKGKVRYELRDGYSYFDNILPDKIQSFEDEIYYNLINLSNALCHAVINAEITDLLESETVFKNPNKPEKFWAKNTIENMKEIFDFWIALLKKNKRKISKELFTKLENITKDYLKLKEKSEDYSKRVLTKKEKEEFREFKEEAKHITIYAPFNLKNLLKK